MVNYYCCMLARPYVPLSLRDHTCTPPLEIRLDSRVYHSVRSRMYDTFATFGNLIRLLYIYTYEYTRNAFLETFEVGP